MPRMINKNYKDSLQNSDADSEGNQDQLRKRLKKGPWTATEDAILTEYVKRYGEGNWNSVQKNSGLARCGKSCRLRWANHLRPNLKKGSFTPEEERIIIELHAKIGNKWARMAAQLPGRTDNEIKNYWNTRIKRRERAGLPIYPHDIQQEAIAYPLQQKQEQRQQQIPSSTSFSSAIFSAPQLNKLNYNTPTHVMDPLSFTSFANNVQNPTHYDVYSQQNNLVKVFSESMNHCGLAKSVSPVSPYDESSSSTVLNQGFTCQSIPTQSRDYNRSGSNPFGLSFTAMLMGVEPYETIEMLSAKETEVPSIQTPSLSLTPASSYTNSGEVFKAGSTRASEYKLASMSSSQKNNGLLEDLVLQGQSISGSSSSRSDNHNLSDKGKSIKADEFVEEEDTMIPNHNETHIPNSQRDEKTFSPPSSTEKPKMGDPLDEMNPMDDDLLCLLTNFPSCMPLPEWYRRGEGHTSSMTTNQKVQHDSTDLF